MSDPDGNLVVRLMREADREAVIGLLWQLTRYEAALDWGHAPFVGDRDVSYEGAVATFEDDRERAATQGGALVVAERRGAVVGFLCWFPQRSGPYVQAGVREEGYVADLVVAEGQRGQGIGQRLLAEAERRTRAKGARRMTIFALQGNDVARAAYERFGFKPHALELMKALD